MSLYTEIETHLCVAHENPPGRLHGHTYQVVVRFRFGADADALKRQVQSVVDRYDHTKLEGELALGEKLAEIIARDLPGCVRVKLRRGPEGINAIWEKAA